MKFKYTARNKKGELQTGNVNAVNREKALGILAQHDLFVLELSQALEIRWHDRLFSYINHVRAKDLMIFTRQFSTLLEAKVSINDSLRTLFKQTTSRRLREVVFNMAGDVDAGLSLSQALERNPDVFSEFYINMIRSAEVTGRMDEVLGFLADYLEKEHGLIARVRNAMIYPAVVIALFIIVSGVIVLIVVPTLRPIFEESNVKLPFFTQILLGVSGFISAWWWVILAVFAGFFVFGLDYVKTPEGRALFDELKLKVPIIGGLLKKLYIARLSEAIGVLLRGGIATTQSIEIASHTVGNAVYSDLLHESAERVNAGEMVSQTFASDPKYFPPLLAQMVAVGESTGRLEDMLKRVSKFYTQEVDDIVANLVELIQPTLIIIIGLLAGLLFASVLLPLYDLAKTF
ncbi:MAG: type II secretion system F family protein [Candidatus Liptonbacteria bacterium]|nr:type II secretion system F family protein [Candidatus Liptonbacteria bacterium]